MKKRLLMILLVVALLVTAAVFAVQADGNFDTSTFVCPCCNKGYDEIEWKTAITSNAFANGDHYHLSKGSHTLTNVVSVTTEAVLLLEDFTLTSKADSRAFSLANAKLHVIGHNGVVNGNGTTGTGGIAMLSAGGELHIYDGITVEKTANCNTGTYGGLFRVYGGTVHVHGGTLNGGAVTTSGGVAYLQANNSKFIMEGGTVNGYAGITNGGVIYSDANLTGLEVTISGGTMNGAEITGDGGAIYMQSGTVTVSGSANVNGGNAYRGGAIYVNVGTVNIQGGTVTGATTKHGGSIFATGGSDVNITGGTIQNGKATLNSNGLGNGGNIYLHNGDLSISGSNTIIQGGETLQTGGNIFLNAGTASITGGQINNGVAPTSGAIHANIALSISNCSFTGNRATGYGGTITFAGGQTHSMTNCTIDGTTTATSNGTHGGAMYVAAGATVDMSGTSISNCTAATSGGALYNMGTVNMTGSSITDCSASQGGAIYTESGKTVTMTNGSISGCTATGHGGAVFVNGGTFNMAGSAQLEVSADSADVSGRGVRVVDGTVTMSGTSAIKGLGTTSGGYGIDICAYGGNASLTLSDSASVYDEGATYRRNILIQEYNENTATLNIASGWEGNASAYFNTVTGDNYGQLLPAANAVAAGAYTGDLRLENNAMSAGLFADDTQLRVSGVSVKTKDVEGFVWYANNAAAVTAADNNANKVIKLYTGADLALDGKTVYVDFNGQTVNVTGEGTLYGIDTATGFTGDAAATANGVAAEPFAVDPLTGITYVAKNGHFYPIQVQMAGVGVNPATTGIYFNSTVQYNPAIESCIKAYGLAASLGTEPNETFYNQDGVLYTFSEGVPAGSFNGNITGILDGGDMDATFGTTDVMAKGYILLNNNGTEQIVLGGLGQESLQSAMQKLNTKWGELESDEKTAVLTMYGQYAAVQAWEGLDTIKEAYDAQ